METRVQAVLIASAVTLVGIFFKDFILARHNDKRKLQQNDSLKKAEAEKSKNEVYLRYAEPLAKASEDLFWRLNEILGVRNRAHFLIKHKHNTTFEKYKYVSTLYRLLALLGWIEAIKKEQLALKPNKYSSYVAISEAFSEIEEALADGPHLEMKRLEALTKLWAIPCNSETDHPTAVALEASVKSQLQAFHVTSATELDAQKKLTLCENISQLLAQKLHTTPVDSALLRSTCDRAAIDMSYREAWIYRDWQSGLGEFVLKKSEHGSRAYEVIGFKEFESIYLSDCTESIRWIERVDQLFSGIDTSINDPRDERPNQLRSTFNAIGKLICALNNSAGEYSPFTPSTLEKAQSLLIAAENN